MGSFTKNNCFLFVINNLYNALLYFNGTLWMSLYIKWKMWLFSLKGANQSTLYIYNDMACIMAGHNTFLPSMATIMAVHLACIMAGHNSFFRFGHPPLTPFKRFNPNWKKCILRCFLSRMSPIFFHMYHQ